MKRAAASLLFLLGLASSGFPQGQILFREEFESGAPGWQFQNGSNGLWRLASPPSCGAFSNLAVYDQPGTCNYSTGLISANAGKLVSPPIALSGQTPFAVSFLYRRQIDASGDMTCAQIAIAGSGNWADLECVNFDNSNSIQSALIPIPATWQNLTVEIAFDFSADFSGNLGDGWFIDEVQVDNGGAPQLPVINSVLPNHVPVSGQPGVILTGQFFSGASAVQIGGAPASFTLLNGTTISAAAPAHAAGWTSISITTPNGTGSLSNAIDYFVPPAPFGISCAPQTLITTGVPTIGQTLTIRTLQLGTNSQYLVFGLSNTIWGSTPLPASLAPYGLPSNCNLYVSPDLICYLGNVSSSANPIPNDASWIGVRVYAQALVLSTPAKVTNAMDILVGP